MFYSQIILAKKGPLGKVWLAAHWGDKKLGRKQVFTTDIAMSVDTICNPAVPLALRVSGHLLLGVVRIYSHQVKFLMRDCEEAMVKIKLAFRPEGEGQAEDAQEYNYNVMDDGNGIGNTGRNHLNVQNFGDISLMPQQFDLSGGGGPIGIGGILVQPVTMEEDGDVFHVPFDLDGKYEYQGNNGEWVEAVDEEGFGDGYGTGNNDFGRKKARRAMELKSQNSQDGSQSLDFHVDNSAIAAVNMTLDSEMMGDGTQRMDEEEENWHAFDPEEDEEEDGERHVFDASDPNADGGLDVTKDTLGTDVSNIELVRADESGRVSMIGRPSVLGSELGSIGAADQSSMKEDKSQVSDTEFPMHQEDEGGIPFEDSTEFQPGETSLLSPGASTDGKRKSVDIGGLDMDVTNDMDETQEEDKETKPKAGKAKRKVPTGPRRRRKRRRIEIDNNATELTSEYIKNMLRDTSDIVQQNRIHPADYFEAEGKKSVADYLLPKRDRMKKNPMAQIIATAPKEILLSRPNCADDGGVHPGLLVLWERNSSRLRGKPLPFKMRGEAGEEQRRELAVDAIESAAAEEAEAEDIEIGRRDESMADKEGRLSLDFPETDADKTFEDQGAEFPQQDDEGVEFPFEEEAEHMAQQDDNGADFTTDMPGMESPTLSEASRGSNFSLGAVNDLEAELADEPRQGQGEDLVSSTSKWHPHTVKVLTMLKRNLEAIDEDEDEEENDNAKELSYDKLSYGTSRRTACGVFFELLQLKTWDFIELGQESSYGDIKISAGTRFAEGAPSE